MLIDKKFRAARIWSNVELKKIASLFEGSIANVSAWQDSDKNGRKYCDYFVNATEYWITNYKSEARGFQGNLPNEVYLDLELDLPLNLENRFDVVFNHTVLEHIYETRKAFSNLCLMSKDVVIIVVPFLQEQHGDYGDYWRFTPLCLKKLYEENGLEIIYLNFNDSPRESIYIFAVGTKKPEKWKAIASLNDNKTKLVNEVMLGKKIIENNLIYHAINIIRTLIIRWKNIDIVIK